MMPADGGDQFYFTEDRAIYPYKGALELWYQKNASLYTDFIIIFLTAWSILFPQNQLTHKIFKDLPVRPF